MTIAMPCSSLGRDLTFVDLMMFLAMDYVQIGVAAFVVPSPRSKSLAPLLKSRQAMTSRLGQPSVLVAEMSYADPEGPVMETEYFSLGSVMAVVLKSPVA